MATILETREFAVSVRTLNPLGLVILLRSTIFDFYLQMLCSLPAVKSGPNWLDRLRSNKGFPVGDDLGLDHFLTNQNLGIPSESSIPSSSTSPHSDPDSTPTNPQFGPNCQRRGHSSISPNENGNPESYGIITGILSELFNMGGASENSKFSGKKFPRKQSKPKICSVPSINNANHMDEKSLYSFQKEENILSSNSDNSLKFCKDGLDKELRGQNVRGKVEEEEDVEEEKGERELIGYSKSEVTVIDTSCDVWKSDKLVFRRKNVWKVKEKKGKLRSYGRKKRKQASESNDVSGISKKAKIWGADECFHLEAQRVHGKESPNPKGHNNDQEISRNAADGSGNYLKENAVCST